MTTRIRLIGTTGDVDALDYGGGFVYTTARNPERVIWEWWEGPIAPSGAELEYSPSYVYTVYRATVPDDVFDYHNWADIDEIASAAGILPDVLLAMGRSHAMSRVRALEMIVGQHGPDEIDQYPEQYRGAELNRRWRRYWARRRSARWEHGRVGI